MYVKTLELYNIRSYEYQKLELSSGINLLVGPNNSGKTTIIKSLNTLQQSSSHFRHEDIQKTKEYGRITLQLSKISDSERDMFKRLDENKSIGAVADSAEQTVTLLLSHNIAKNEHLFFDSNLRQEKDKSGKIKIYDSFGLDAKFCIFPFFSNYENKGNFIYPFFAKRKTSYYNGNKDDAYYVHDDLRSLPGKIKKLSNPTHPSNEQFQFYCKEILGFSVGIVPEINGNNNSEKIGFFTTDDQPIYVENMGEGVANILGLIAILLTKSDKLFLIEELENDIHPAALKKLLDFIIRKSADNQFVISTHSNIVVKYLAAASNAKLFYIQQELVEKEYQGNSIKLPHSSISEVENTPVERMRILEELGYDFFDFDLYKSYLILEESSAESIINQILIPTFFPELCNKIKTISAGGVDALEARLSDFLRLFVFIHNTPIYKDRAWVIADGDDIGIKNIKKIKTAFSTWPNDSFINFEKENFEDYYPSIFQEEVKKIFLIEDKKKKKEEKILLVKKVLDWSKDNPSEAITEFEASAAEVIGILKDINDKLKAS